MNAWIRLFGLTVLATVSVWAGGCSGDQGKPKDGKADATKVAGHKDGEHKGADHKDKDHKEGSHKDTDHKESGHKDGAHKDHKKDEHHDKPLTLKDIKVPASFKAGVARLEELHKQIHHLIEHGELPKVHRVAEEMSLLAGEMKRMAQKEVAEDRQTEARAAVQRDRCFLPHHRRSCRRRQEGRDLGDPQENGPDHRKAQGADQVNSSSRKTLNLAGQNADTTVKCGTAATAETLRHQPESRPVPALEREK